MTLLGRDGDDCISAAEWADKVDTITYEVFCNISKRVPRVFVNREPKAVKREPVTPAMRAFPASFWWPSISAPPPWSGRLLAADGTLLAETRAANPQRSCGADILTRLQRALEGHGRGVAAPAGWRDAAPGRRTAGHGRVSGRGGHGGRGGRQPRHQPPALPAAGRVRCSSPSPVTADGTDDHGAGRARSRPVRPAAAVPRGDRFCRRRPGGGAVRLSRVTNCGTRRRWSPCGNRPHARPRPRHQRRDCLVGRRHLAGDLGGCRPGVRSREHRLRNARRTGCRDRCPLSR